MLSALTDRHNGGALHMPLRGERYRDDPASPLAPCAVSGLRGSSFQYGLLNRSFQRRSTSLDFHSRYLANGHRIAGLRYDDSDECNKSHLVHWSNTNGGCPPTISFQEFPHLHLDPSNPMYDEVLAPILLACCGGIFLFGVQSLQTATYYHRGYKDPLHLRLTVIFMWLLELAHNSIIFILAYKCLITYFGDSQGLAKSQRFLSTNGTIAVLIATLGQSYSGWRLYQLQDVKSWIIPSICWISSFIRTVIYVTAVAHQINPRPFLQTKPWRVCVMLVGILSLVADLITAWGLFVELWARRHNVPLRESQALATEAEYPLRQCPVAVIIDKIILICISTNLITCFCTAITMGLLYGMPNMYWMPASYICSRLFSICFISLVLQGRRLKDRLRSPGIASNQPEPEHIALRAVARSSSNEVQPSMLEAGFSQFPGHLAPETSTVTTEEGFSVAHAVMSSASLK